jgi:fructoselysine 6-phosphate deglycase
MSDTVHPTDIIEAQLARAIAAIAAKTDIKNVFFAACGGSNATLQPAAYTLQEQTGEVAALALNAREFTTRAPKALGPHSLVITCSHSGNTPETVAATEFARAAGATTIALTNLEGSPLDEAAEYTIFYQHGEGKQYAYTGSPLLYRLTWAILDHVNGTQIAPAADAAVAAFDDIVAATTPGYVEQADKWAFAHRRDELIYTLSSGVNYWQGYSFSICFLQEMLWVHSQGINSAEYFHGPFEITDFDVPFIELLGLGEARAIDQRAHDFVTQHADSVVTLDAASWDLSAVDEDLRPSYAQLVFGPVLRVFADALSDHRGHPMSVRRYMWRMEY